MVFKSFRKVMVLP